MNRPASLLLLALLAAASISHSIAQVREAGTSERPDLPKVYHVELIVFEHLSGRSDRLRADRAADFTDHPDPLLIARGYRALNRMLEGGGSILPLFRPGRTGPEAPRLIGPEQVEIVPLPYLYAATTALSDEMADVLVRLENSGLYRPLTWRGWFQTAQQNRQTAALRIHDDRIAAWLEPEAARAFEQDPAPENAASTTPASRRSTDPFPATEDFESALLFASYRLDGTVRLRQRQFLHLDLDLVVQDPPREPVDERRGRPAVNPADSGDLPAARAGSVNWRLHRLRQSRVINVDRMEYFDSSLVGVLVRVSEFEQFRPEPAPKPPEPDVVDETAPGAVGRQPSRNSPVEPTAAPEQPLLPSPQSPRQSLRQSLRQSSPRSQPPAPSNPHSPRTLASDASAIPARRSTQN